MMALHKYAKGRIDDAILEDEASEILSGAFARAAHLAKIESLSAFIYRAAHNRVINLLKNKQRRMTDQIAEGTDLAEPAAKAESILDFFRDARPKEYDFIIRATELVDWLYRVSLARDNPNIAYLLCVERTFNVLWAAKKEIDNLRDPDNFGVHKFFYDGRGNHISRWLQDETDILWAGRESIKGLPHALGFPNFVIDAIPKLRADPVMLILRVFYKKFRVGSGKHKARELIEKIIRELGEQEAASKRRRTDIFGSVLEGTNFETLRKKIYREKSADPFYGKVADWICEVCDSAN